MKRSGLIFFALLQTAFAALPLSAQSEIVIGDIPSASPIAPYEVVLPSTIFEQHRAAGDSLMMIYDFDGALTEYVMALRSTSDTSRENAVESRMALCERAFEMTGECYRPTVVAKERFSVADFYLYYPLEDKSWHINTAYPDLPIYAPKGASDIFYSVGDRIFPMVFGDTMYFSSASGDGVGGLDIFKCRWDSRRNDWGKPENLGIPFNTPYDDYLYIDTEDGNYSIFASNRECPGTDSVYVYVLERNDRPVRVSVDTADEVRELCMLNPSEDLKKINNSNSLVGLEPDRRLEEFYNAKVNEIRQLRDSLDQRIAALSSDEELAELRRRLEAAGEELNLIETDFLQMGESHAIQTVTAEADKEIIGVGSSYTFTRKTLGPPVNFLVVGND